MKRRPLSGCGTKAAAPVSEEPLLGTRVTGRDEALSQASFRERALKAGFSEAEVDVLNSIYGKAQKRT